MGRVKSKNKNKNQEKSPQKDKNKANSKEKDSLGKENNCMNKTLQEEKVADQNNSNRKENKTSPTTKMKKGEEDQTRESKALSSEPSSEEGKKIEDFEKFLKTCCKSKRKVLIKPNIPKKWIQDLRAKLAIIKSK